MDNAALVDFRGKTIVVTGASSGIGQAIAIELSRYGANVISIGRSEERLKETHSHLTPGNHRMLNLDLNDCGAIVPCIREVAGDVGRIYGFCHSAGIVETRPLTSSKVEGLNHMLSVNLVAGIEICKAISRRDIMDENGGSFLFISSVYGITGKPGQVGYSASKGAVTAAARSMAVELARRRIRVNTLSPGLVRTPMVKESFARLSSEQIEEIECSFPLGTGTPQDVARAAVFLLAPQNIWITGTDFVIDGGYTAQ